VTSGAGREISDVDSTQVTIVGAGPVGLSLALGLARHGVGTTLVERERSTSEHSKAPGIHVRSLEALHQWGVAEPLRDAGTFHDELRLHHPGPDTDPGSSST
jgi:2-polyprenyl-6-methoxyphenol hydroxylase-like FAD-dependent oxidoreductase